MAHNYTLAEGTVLRSTEFTYTIEKVLGQGGFGITYLATAEVMVGNIPQEVKFAIKEHFVSQLCERNSRTLCVEYSGPVSEMVTKSRRDFLREARRLQQLGIKHPNIVRINEVFEANNTAYYVMEYLGDMTLQKYVASKGKLDLYETETILSPVINAVAMLNDNRLAHYDIKPGNIMLKSKHGRIERPVLIDFGLAKHYDEDGNATSTLGAGGYSAGYAPLEQIQGIREFSPRCDVYALAAVAYFCLTGQRPPEAIKARKEVLMTALSAATDAHTAEAITRGMSMLDDNRTPDARSLANDIFSSDDPTILADPDITVAPKTNEIVEIDIESKPDKSKAENPAKKPNIPDNKSKPNHLFLELNRPIKVNKKREAWITIGFIGITAILLLICAFLLANNISDDNISTPNIAPAKTISKSKELEAPEPTPHYEYNYEGAIGYLDTKEQWVKSEMEIIPGLKGLYDLLNTYQFQQILTTINKLGCADMIQENGQIKYLKDQINKHVNSHHPDMYSNTGTITIPHLFEDLDRRNNTISKKTRGKKTRLLI